MRTAYKVLAYLVAAEVAVQGMVMVWAIAGLGKWVNGGVFDKSVIEGNIETGAMPFPEVLGILVHGINGMFVVPGFALVVAHRLVLHQGARSDQMGPHRVWAGGGAGSARLPGP